MANQIATNVPTGAAPEYAVAHHIEQFWTPVMRQRLNKEADRSRLLPIVLRALELDVSGRIVEVSD
jgi:hypothetical protein